jgi:hypothetical protein
VDITARQDPNEHPLYGVVRLLFKGLVDQCQRWDALLVIDDPEADQDSKDRAVTVLANHAVRNEVLTEWQRLVGQSREAIDEFIQRLEREKRQPWVSTDRSPRRKRTLIDGHETVISRRCPRQGRKQARGAMNPFERISRETTFRYNLPPRRCAPRPETIWPGTSGQSSRWAKTAPGPGRGCGWGGKRAAWKSNI